MKCMAQSFYLLSCFALLLSCNKSNSLQWYQAENTIREYLFSNNIETAGGTVSQANIFKVEKPNIFAQFNTSVKVYFKNKTGGQGLPLLFVFSRTAKNKWFLSSVEPLDKPEPALAEWLKARQKLRVDVSSR